MVTWIVTIVDTDTHAVETITETIVEAICMLTAELALMDHATLTLIHHVPGMDMDTHAEIMTTTMIAMDTIMEVVIHQAHHAETASESTSIDTETTVMTTVEDMVTWIVTTMDTDTHAVETITE